ncbi:MAG: EamA family transporter [Clostridia bacterium]|nr:EamA family transporter [Clostridia bacterium]
MNNKRGMLCVALGAISWSFAGVLCKFIPWNPFTINGIRSLFAAVLLAILRKGVKVKFTRGNILGALGVSLTCILYMIALKFTTAANAIVLQYAMPVFVIAFCWIFYKQKPGMSNTVTAAFVIIGVVLCSWEGITGQKSGTNSAFGDGIALLSAVTFSLVFFCSKLPDADSQEYSYLGLVMCTPFALYAFFDPSMTVEPAHWGAALLLACALGFGYFFMAKGMKSVTPISAALISNLEPILNPIWVFVFMGENPGVLTIVGAVIVLTAATVYTLFGSKSGT